MRVALVNMPWTRVDSPSIQCGLLKAECAEAGHPAVVHYLNLEFAARLGDQTYRSYMHLRDSHAPKLVGEWLFAASAFGDRDDEDEYLNLIEDVLSSSPLTREQVLDMRHRTIPEWIEEVAASPRWDDADVVGFTSTFEQNVAALALARKLKSTHPDLTTVFGGANFDGTMGPEYVRVFDWIDYAVIGEGDAAFPDLLHTLEAGDSSAIPGVCCRRDGTVHLTPPLGARVAFNKTPAPDYDDYFSALDRLGRRTVLGPRSPHLLYESARGCWWGEKHHCTFCGLNHAGMQFRSKDPDKVHRELVELSDRHRSLFISMVDNIMDMSYIDSLLPKLTATRHDFRIFYEIKANQRRDQIESFARAGIVGVQPGIESLSDNILKIMRKGSTAATNINLLKWCAFYGIDVKWNILLGFPGETAADYDDQTALVPLLHHLPPPDNCEEIWLERFSPYFFEPEIAFLRRRPALGYRYAYPSAVDLEKTAYFFEYETATRVPSEAGERLRNAVQQWQAVWEGRPPRLDYEHGGEWLRIIDTRGGVRREAVLSGWRADAFELCVDRAHTAPAVAELLAAGDREIAADAVAAFLDRCVDTGIAIRSAGRYLSLALPIKVKNIALPASRGAKA